MYKVEFIKLIKTSFGGSKESVCIKTELPFIPQVDMTYIIGSETDYLEVNADEIEEVAYYQGENTFKVWTGEDRVLYDNADKEKRNGIDWEAPKEELDTQIHINWLRKGT